MKGSDVIDVEVLQEKPYVYTKIDLTDEKGRFKAIDTFKADSYSEEFDDKIFDLPEGDAVKGSCYATCPAGRACPQ
jgi:hypothetical protein